MNDLNSCLIEGTLKSRTETEFYTDFVIDVVRHDLAENGELVEVHAEVPCRIIPGSMRDVFKKYAKINYGVRIVGHLSGTPEKIVLVAEHIEYRLHKKAEKKEA